MFRDLVQVETRVGGEIYRISHTALDRADFGPNRRSTRLEEGIVGEFDFTITRLPARMLDLIVEAPFLQGDGQSVLCAAEQRRDVPHRQHHANRAVLFRHKHRFPLDGVEKFAEGVFCVGRGNSFHLRLLVA